MSERRVPILYMYILFFVVFKKSSECTNRNLQKSTLRIEDINKKFTNRLRIFIEKIYLKWYNTMSICLKMDIIEEKGV